MSDPFLTVHDDAAAAELRRRHVDPAVAAVLVATARQAGYASLPEVGITYDEDGFLIDANGSDQDPPGHRDVVLAFTREQVTQWAGRELTDDDLILLREALPWSTFPETVGAIADKLTDTRTGGRR
jgi:hypothetical protein